MRKLTALTVVLILASMLLGCQSKDGGSACADIRYRVFEAARDTVEKAVPNAERTPLDNSAYLVAQVSAGDLESLLKGISADTSLLVDQSRVISWWPKVADTWSYSKADRTLLGGGSGAGFLGVRSKGGSTEIRIEYNVMHNINTGESTQSKISYEGPAPEEGGIVFLKPFERKDGTKLVHVIVFETTNWKY